MKKTAEDMIEPFLPNLSQRNPPNKAPTMHPIFTREAKVSESSELRRPGGKDPSAESGRQQFVIV
jgi:hypothetical protein